VYEKKCYFYCHLLSIYVIPCTYDETRRYLTVLICFAYRAVGRGKASTIFFFFFIRVVWLSFCVHVLTYYYTIRFMCVCAAALVQHRNTKTFNIIIYYYNLYTACASTCVHKCMILICITSSCII